MYLSLKHTIVINKYYLKLIICLGCPFSTEYFYLPRKHSLWDLRDGDSSQNTFTKKYAEYTTYKI